LVAEGIYFVTDFESFVKPGGNLAGLGLTDGIGSLNKVSGGELSVKIRGIVDAPASLKGQRVDAVLGVHCALPGGAAGITEGITFAVPALNLNFVQQKGQTLFHVLED
jgi:hypothetical protein